MAFLNIPCESWSDQSEDAEDDLSFSNITAFSAVAPSESYRASVTRKIRRERLMQDQCGIAGTHDETSAVQDAIRASASVAFWLLVTAERGEWDLSPPLMQGLIVELGGKCIGPNRMSPEAAVNEFILAWGVAVGRTP